MDYKIIDNFLPADDFSQLQSVMMGDWMPWYYNKTVIDDPNDTRNYQFTHVFFQENVGISSPQYSILSKIIEKLNPRCIFAIKANLSGRTDKHENGGWHIDQTFPGSRTAVLYLNTNNGYTLFPDGTRVDSLENRFVEFDPSIMHTGVSQTDEQVRCVLNLNYIL